MHDEPFTDARFAFYSHQSRLLMLTVPPFGVPSATPFNWATSGRATLNTEIMTAAGSLSGFTRTPASATFGAPGGLGTIGVTGADHCAWTAVTNADAAEWITILRPTGRSHGAANVVYALKGNTTGAARLTESIQMLGDAFGWKLDKITDEIRPKIAEQTVESEFLRGVNYSCRSCCLS